MQVLKFGGTSVGTPARMKEVAALINTADRKVVVLSATAGTTNLLVTVTEKLKAGDLTAATYQISQLEERMINFIAELYDTQDYRFQGQESVRPIFERLRALTVERCEAKQVKEILAFGEMISTRLFNLYLAESDISTALLSSLEFVQLNAQGEPDLSHMRASLSAILSQYPETINFIVQGFICRNVAGEIDNLQRGGSDYTAALVGAAIQAEGIQIWTDIDGMHNNDPREVEGTRSIANLSYEEAAELAYFGAKILHPSTVWPAREANIPLWVKNTMDPEAHGTLISNDTPRDQIKAIAAKEGITAIKIRSARMLMAYGFLRRIFEIFEQYHTPIDLITTSEVSVRLTIDDPTFSLQIVEELRKLGEVSVETDLAIVCVVGDFLAERPGYASRVIAAVDHIPVHMISYGGSKNNISLVVDSECKKEALRSLHAALFQKIPAHV